MVVFQWQTKGTESWLKSSVYYQHHSNCYDKSFSEGRDNDDNLHLLNCTRNYSQLSPCSTMSKKCMPTFVYQRRKKNKPSNDSKSNDCGRSAINAGGVMVTGQDRLESGPHCTLGSVKTSVKHPNECDRPTKSLYGSSSGENCASEEVLLVDMDRIANACTVNDDCSSSISDLKCNSASSKNDVEDAEDRPSSVSLLPGKIPQEMSERDICIAILRSQGLLDTIRTRQDRSSAAANSSAISNNYRSILCKICARVGNTSRMLVCDSCEDAFHISCSGCQIIPAGEWHCGCCLKKIRVMLKEKSVSDSISVNNEKLDNNQDPASEVNLGSLGFMFTETEPYMSKVRVGDEFQATIPDWHGPCDDKGDHGGNPLQMNYSNIDLQETESSKLSSIGNWIQCRAVVEGIGEHVDGTICAKWRRAPLFEVQTNDWECFRCILWDPAHADCAVPQELSTEDVMRQLKYIELLKPRLAAKRRNFVYSEPIDLQETLKHRRDAEKAKRKTDCSKNVDSQKQARS